MWLNFEKNDEVQKDYVILMSNNSKQKATELTNNIAEPFLRWAGGKRLLIKKLLNYVPGNIGGTYREPFLGAGALFFALKPEKSLLSDANRYLIDCFEYVRDNPDLIHVYLEQHSKISCEQYYYSVRDQYNNCLPSVAQAARFIYLNKTCFNGIFRVNKQGKFNVPYGRKEPPFLPSFEELKNISAILKKSRLKVMPFEKALSRVSKSDFIYLDPPYPPLNGTSYFTHYTSDRFLKEDQERLSDIFNKLDRTGCKVMMTNASIPMINNLYKKYNIYELSVVRYITCKTTKHLVSELVITNY